jgi:hypothetical protein
MYGIVVGAISTLIGLVLIFCSRLDSLLADDPAGARDMRENRIGVGIFFLLGGVLSLSAVLFGWPPVRGYLVPPR